MEMELYRHRQVGTLIVAVMIPVALLCAAGSFLAPNTPAFVPWLVAGILLLVLWLFASLTVTITENSIAAAFGPGLIHKTIPLERIVSAHAVHNSWLCGWGIRFIPGGTMFNVSGLEAVELEYSNGGKFRIGTDEPVKLEAAIQQALTSAHAVGR
jgi:hypothetical protein